MKKLIVLLLSIIAIFSICVGCRKQNSGVPGDPTVNNTTTPTIPTMTSPLTRPSTDPTMHTTVPDSSENTVNTITGENDLPVESATNSDARNRDRMLPRR